LAFEEQWALQEGSFAEEPLSGVTFEAAGSDLVAVLQAEGGDEEVSPIYHAYLEAMRTAADRIWITQAYFAPDEEFMRHINNAVARGVDVRLLVPGQSDSNSCSMPRSRYGKLLEHGVKIYEPDIDTSRQDRCDRWNLVDRGLEQPRLSQFPAQRRDQRHHSGADFARQMEARFRRISKTARKSPGNMVRPVAGRPDQESSAGCSHTGSDEERPDSNHRPSSM
jgi:hypothetical protein